MTLAQEVHAEPEIRYRPAAERWKAATIVEFADGVKLFRYEDGTYKLVCKDSFVIVEEVINRKPGTNHAEGAIKAYFAPINPN